MDTSRIGVTHSTGLRRMVSKKLTDYYMLEPRVKQQRRDVLWDRQAWQTLLKALLPWNLRSPNRLDVRRGLALAVAGVANASQPFLVCKRWLGSAVGPGLGLVNGTLCSDCDLAADVEVIASGKASVTITVTVTVLMDEGRGGREGVDIGEGGRDE
eukprot:363543-Chlamydomonas_euryale.AAC.4